MRVIIFGSQGYLGGHWHRHYPDAVCPKVDIADAKEVGRILDEEKPDMVINAAGKTGRPNIDWCESHKMETVHSNLLGPLMLLEECGKRRIYWVHLSSGCIYEGDKGGAGFTEDDPPNFFGSYYSRIKGWSEGILKEFTETQGGILILRLRMPFDASNNERNLLMKLKGYRKVLDVQNSLTYLPDFLVAAHVLIVRRRTGIFNIVNPGSISPYQIMEAYKKNVDRSHSCERLRQEELSSVTNAGRSNCVLSTEKLAREGLTLPNVHMRIEEALGAIAKNTSL